MTYSGNFTNAFHPSFNAQIVSLVIIMRLASLTTFECVTHKIADYASISFHCFAYSYAQTPLGNQLRC